MPLYASEVMDRAATLLNDRAKTIWTYTVLLPYLQTAWDDLQLELENHHVPVTKEVSATINVTAGATSVTLPANLVEIVSVKERTQGSSEDWTNMEESDWPLLNYTKDNMLHYYNWNGEALIVCESTANREVKIQYKKSLSAISSENSIVALINAKPYLAFKTAAIAADLSGRAPDVATRLETRAAIALNKMIAIKVGAYHNKPIRRRPYGESMRIPGRIYKVT